MKEVTSTAHDLQAIQLTMSTDLSARSRVEAMLDKWEAAERGPGQAPPPALGRRRQQQGETRGRSAHLKRQPPGGRRQHYGGRAAAAAPYSLESVGSCSQRSCTALLLRGYPLTQL